MVSKNLILQFHIYLNSIEYIFLLFYSSKSSSFSLPNINQTFSDNEQQPPKNKRPVSDTKFKKKSKPQDPQVLYYIPIYYVLFFKQL